MPKMKVQLRGGFSDRNKIKTENTTIQTTEFDERTRAALATATSIIYERLLLNYYDEPAQRFIKSMYSEVYGVFVNWGLNYSLESLMKAIYETIKDDEYDAVLTVIEYLAREMDREFYFENRFYTATKLYNEVFEREYVGYRFVNNYIMPITDGVEIEVIEDAVLIENREVRQHIQKAIGFLADRDAPDYANSIKESISAVERMCSSIVGKGMTLGDALKAVEDLGVGIHPALKKAFLQLYGYTSDASGLRHAGQLGGKDATFEEAKFMLVSCCAFVNYLTGVIAKTEK